MNEYWQVDVFRVGLKQFAVWGRFEHVQSSYNCLIVNGKASEFNATSL